MSEVLIIVDEHLGTSGVFIKSEIIGLSVCTDDEAMMSVHLRNGTVAKCFAGYERYEDVYAKAVSDMGWS